MMEKTGKAVDRPSHAAEPGTRWFDGLLVFLCGVILASRCQMNESFPSGWRIAGPPESIAIAMPETPAMLLLAGILFTLFAVWMIRMFMPREFFWRNTSLGISFFLLLIGGILSCTFASNKNTAWTACFTLLSQMALTILLVQLLRTRLSRRILLGVIAAAGTVMAYRCMEQYYYEMPELVESFRQDPNAVLAAQGIEPGSFTAEQFAGRIASRDVGGFFAISNTAAAFFVLSLFATAALIVSRCPRKTSAVSQWVSFVLLILMLLFQGFALLLTKSKGGIAATGSALLIAAGIFFFRRFLSKHWRAGFLAALILLVLSVSAIIAYGMTHNRLPSASMWVRWQYWQASTSMIADHVLTGVGPQNFGQQYPRYMDPAAPEVVMDPHSLPVSLWAQWGVFGFLAFLWAMLAVSIRMCRPRASVSPNGPESTVSSRRSILRILFYGAAMSASIFIVRRCFSDLSGVNNPQELFGVYLLLFFMPALVWLISFIITQASDGECSEETIGSAEAIVLGAGILGFLIHNAVDMAFFQPGVGTCFFATLAILIAVRQGNHVSSDSISPHRWIRIVGSVGCVILVALVWGKIVPMIRGYNQTRQAQEFAFAGQMDAARSFANRAIQSNPSDPDPAFLRGQLDWSEYLHSRTSKQEWFNEAINAFQEAAQRDPENFRYFQTLAELYEYASEHSPDQPEFLEKAIFYAKETLRLHPAKSEYYVFYGDLLVRGNKPDLALEAYRKALDLERDYQQLHQRMFPNAKDLKQRMNPRLWKKTQERIKSLQNDGLDGKIGK